MADLLAMSAGIIDGTIDAGAVGPINRINHQLSEIGVGVALHHRKPLGDAAVDALTRQLDAAPVDAPAFQQLQQIAIATADVEHFRAALDHLRHQQMVAAIIFVVRRRNTVERQNLLL